MSDMGSADEFRQRLQAGQPVVAFDFDGTLTIRDSFTEFLRWRASGVVEKFDVIKHAP